MGSIIHLSSPWVEHTFTFTVGRKYHQIHTHELHPSFLRIDSKPASLEFSSYDKTNQQAALYHLSSSVLIHIYKMRSSTDRGLFFDQISHVL